MCANLLSRDFVLAAILALCPSFLHVCDRKGARKTMRIGNGKKEKTNELKMEPDGEGEGESEKNVHDGRANNKTFEPSDASQIIWHIVTHTHTSYFGVREGMKWLRARNTHWQKRQTHTDWAKSPRFSWVSSFSLFSSLSGEWMYNNNKCIGYK